MPPHHARASLEDGYFPPPRAPSLLKYPRGVDPRIQKSHTPSPSFYTTAHEYYPYYPYASSGYHGWGPGHPGPGYPGGGGPEGPPPTGHNQAGYGADPPSSSSEGGQAEGPPSEEERPPGRQFQKGGRRNINERAGRGKKSQEEAERAWYGGAGHRP